MLFIVSNIANVIMLPLKTINQFHRYIQKSWYGQYFVIPIFSFFLFLFFSYKAMKFDDILVHLGQFGYYQKRLYLLLCLPAVSTGCYMMMLVFVMHAP